MTACSLEMLSQVLTAATLSCWLFVGLSAFSNWKACSIGLRSGDWLSHWRIFYLPSNSLEWTRSIGSHACPCLTVDVVCFGSWAVPFFHHTILFINLIRLILLPVLECYQWFAVLHLVVNPLIHSWRSLLTRFSQCTSPRGFMPIQSEGARAPSDV